MTTYDYFLENKGFKRFFEKCLQKYSSYGKVTGIIVLADINKEEAETFTRFFGKIYEEGMTVKIKISEFLKAINNSKLEGFDFLTYFKLIYKDFNGLSKKEENLKSIDDYQKYLLNLPVDLKLKSIIVNPNKSFNAILHLRYKKNKYELT